MLLTTKQVAQKLGVRLPVVSRLARTGKLMPANPERKSARTHYEFDPKVVREFAATYVPVPHVSRKPKGNGHSDHPELPFDIVAVQARLDRIEAMQARLGSIEEKLDELLAVWK